MLKKYLLYIIRWQLSTPILYVVIWLLTDYLNAIWITVIANFIGSLIFFWVDKFIFKKIVSAEPLWEIKGDVVCSDCGKRSTGYRIVEWGAYNRIKDANPQFRCEDCRGAKQAEVKEKLK